MLKIASQILVLIPSIPKVFDGGSINRSVLSQQKSADRTFSVKSRNTVAFANFLSFLRKNFLSIS